MLGRERTISTERMSIAQLGIQESIPKIMQMDSVCVEGEDLHRECSSSVSPCSAGQAAYVQIEGTGEE